MKKQYGFTSVEMIAALFGLFIVVGGGFGWVWNIVKMFSAISDPLTAMFIARAVGIFFAPLGAILGYL